MIYGLPEKGGVVSIFIRPSERDVASGSVTSSDEAFALCLSVTLKEVWPLERRDEESLGELCVCQIQ